MARIEQQVREGTSQLQAMEESFRLLVEGTRDYAIFMLDPQGHIITWNPGAECINGYRAEEIIGQHFSRFYGEDDVQAGKPAMELKIAKAEGKYEEEGWRVRKDGSRFWSSVVITALFDEDGNLRGFSKITRDITERKIAEVNARKLLQEQAARTAAEHMQRLLHVREKTARFLADASQTLAGLVDYHSTLQRLSQLAVPFFADWCAVDMLETDDSLQRVGVAYGEGSDPKVPEELVRRLSAEPNAAHGVWHVLRTGLSEISPVNADLEASSRAKVRELSRIVLEFGVKSYLAVPLRGAERRLECSPSSWRSLAASSMPGTWRWRRISHTVRESPWKMRGSLPKRG